MGCVDCQWDRCIRAQWLWQQPGLGADRLATLRELTIVRPLIRDDIHSSLWEGGTIEFTAGCNNGRYVALRVVAYPPS